jgi:hypothetical protein
VITRSKATQAPWVKKEEEEEEEEKKKKKEEKKEKKEEKKERDTILIDLLSMNSNKPDFFNNRSDGIEKTMEETAIKRTVNIDTIFDIKRPLENKEKANNITIPLLSSIKRACLDFCIKLLN